MFRLSALTLHKGLRFVRVRSSHVTTNSEKLSVAPVALNAVRCLAAETSWGKVAEEAAKSLIARGSGPKPVPLAVTTTTRANGGTVPGAGMAEKLRLFVDCDAGTDDAGGLIIALKNPNCEIVAISTVHGNAEVDQCTLNVLRLLNAAGRRDIPVHRGCAGPLTGTRHPTDFHGKDGFGDCEDEFVERDSSQISAEHASDALIRASHEHEGQLVLVCLGPLTNIARALTSDPQLGRRLKKCVVMGGSHEGVGNLTPYAEFNFASDPQAAKIVLELLGCPMCIATLELARRSTMALSEFEAMLAGGNRLSRFFKGINAVILSSLRSAGSKYQLYDELAMTIALDSSLISEEARCSASVDASEAVTRGRMLVRWNEDKNIFIVLKADVDRFKEMYASCFM